MLHNLQFLQLFFDITDRSRALTWFLNAVRESAILIDLWSFDQIYIAGIPATILITLDGKVSGPVSNFSLSSFRALLTLQLTSKEKVFFVEKRVYNILIGEIKINYSVLFDNLNPFEGPLN